MGIKHLHDVLKKCGVFANARSLRNYRGMRLAVDTSLYICKYKAIMAEEWIRGIIQMVVVLRKHNIHCVFIYDDPTCSPIEKEKERQKRRDRVESVAKKIDRLEADVKACERDGELPSDLLLETHYKLEKKTGSVPLERPSLLGKQRQGEVILDPLDRAKGLRALGIDLERIKNYIYTLHKQIACSGVKEEDVWMTKRLFDDLKVPYLTSDTEAEALGSWLCKGGYVDGVVSEDTDCLCYGCPVFLHKMDIVSETVMEYNMKDVLVGMNMEMSEFQDLCIMLGCDYNSNIPKVGMVSALRYIKEYKSIECIQETMQLDTVILNTERVRGIFTNEPDLSKKVPIPYCGIPELRNVLRWKDTGLILENYPSVFVAELNFIDELLF